MMQGNVKSLSFSQIRKSWSESVDFVKSLPNGADQKIIIDLVSFSHDPNLSEAAAKEMLLQKARESTPT